MGRRGPKPRKGEAITRAALELFVERGVKGATTREIARRAQSTEGSLYRYYAGKQDLARRVLLECLSSLGESVAKALEGVAGPRQRLRTYVRAYLEYVRDHPLEHAFIQQSRSPRLLAAEEQSSRPRTLLVDILTDGMAHGVFYPSDPRVLASFILGGVSRAFPADAAKLEAEAAEEAMRQLDSAIERLVVITGTWHHPRAVVPVSPSEAEPM
jgi:AcrR family transcriptional regulator